MPTLGATSERVCAVCGQIFSPRGVMGRPRLRCYECAPPEQPRLRPKPVPDAEFRPTVDHFRDWARQIVLDNNETWEPDAFFCDFVEDLFAGYRECWLVVPEGNGKTTSMAGLALYVLLHTPFAKIPWAASSRDQAKIGFEQAQGMILRTPGFDKIFRPMLGSREIRLRANESALIKIYAADMKTGDGIIPTLGVLDELHRHKDLGLYRTWTGKLEKRHGQIIVISTAGEPKTEFELTREVIRTQGSQTRRPGFTRSAGGRVVLHDWAISEEDDPDDLVAVKTANPSPRITIESLREKHDSLTFSPSHWSRLTCNRPTRGALAAITEAEWANACSTDRIPPDGEVWLGIDCGFKRDTTAIVPLWDRDDGKCLIGEAEILVPPRDGTQMDVNLVKDALRGLKARYRVCCVVMDTSFAIDIAQWIATELDIEVAERPQTNKLAVIEYEEFLVGLRTGNLLHTGDPGLTSHVMNAIALQMPEGKSKFERPKQARSSVELQDLRVIDALKAASMAHSQLLLERGSIPKERPRAISLHEIPDDDEEAA